MLDNLVEWLDPEFITNMAIGFVPKAIAAIVVFLLFWLALKLTRRPLRSILSSADFEDALVTLLVDNVFRFTVLILGIVMAASQLGIDVGAALAGLGVAGIAVGFAAQDSVANTISGFLIFWDKPFRLEDYIRTEKVYGEVVQITMRTTRIRTRDNTYAIIPNKEIIQGTLFNHSMYGETRVNVPVGVAYKEDTVRAREVILAAVRARDRILDEPAPDVVVSELADSSVNLIVRVWIARAVHEKPVFYDVLETCKRALDDADIEIPFPHLQLFVDDVKDRVWNGLTAVERH